MPIILLCHTQTQKMCNAH